MSPDSPTTRTRLLQTSLGAGLLTVAVVTITLLLHVEHPPSQDPTAFLQDVPRNASSVDSRALPGVRPSTERPLRLTTKGEFVTRQEGATPGTGSLVGTLRDEKGYVRSDIPLHVRPTDGSTSEQASKTDMWGEYAFADLQPGPWTMSYELEGMSYDVPPDGSPIDVRGDLQRRVDVTLPPPHLIRGVVLRDEEPVQGALVQFLGGRVVARSGTNHSGEFELRVSRPITGKVWAQKDDIPTAPVPVTVSPGSTPELTIHFGSSRLTGRVVDAFSGQPVTRASVTVRSPTTPAGSAQEVHRYTVGDGRFELEHLHTGMWQVRASSRRSLPTRWIDLAIQETGDTEVVLQMTPGATLIGRVVDGNSELLTTILRVKLVEAGDESRFTSQTVGGDRGAGVYSFNGLRGGDYVLIAEEQDHSSVRWPRYRELARARVRLVEGRVTAQNLVTE